MTREARDANLPAGNGVTLPGILNRLPVVALLLALLLAVVYAPALRGGYIWDDDSYVTRNENLQSVDGLRRIWLEPHSSPQYYPLVFTGFWVEHRLWGLKPFGYHAVNVLLHLLNALLLWLFLRRFSPGWALLAAVIFALHPVHVESVAWVTERKNVLSTALYLGSALTYLRCAPLEPEAPAPRGRWLSYSLSLLLFVGALLAKSVASTLPAALLLAIWWKRGRLRWSDVAPLAPLFLIGIVSGLNTAYLEKHHVGASGADWNFSVVERLLIAGRTLWFYAAKLAWPDPLVFFYPRWEIDANRPLQYLFPLGAVAAISLLWAMRRRLGRGPLAAVLFFAGTLLPASGFFNVYPMRYSFVADHFQYLASIGLITLFSGALVQALSRLTPSKAGSALLVLTATLALVLGSLSWSQARSYADEETLWRDTLAKNDQAFAAHNNLGTLLEARGELLEAMNHYELARKARPGNADAYYNIGVVLEKLGETARAKTAYDDALRVDPAYAKAYNNRGIISAARGDLASAQRDLATAVHLNPDYATGHCNLAMVLAGLGKAAEAEEHYRQAIQINPDFARAHYGLGALLVGQGRVAEAAGPLERARALDPSLFLAR